MVEQFKRVNTSGRIKINLGHKVWEAEKSFIISNMIAIVKKYQSEGYSLTLRQLYYQLVAKDIIPNHDKVYAKLSSLKDDCCYGGYLDWEAFEDRGRQPHTSYFEENKEDALRRTIASYRLDRQAGQKNHVEVWTEKDAISSIIKKVTYKYILTTVVNKGYSSSTAMYGAYTRFKERIENNQRIKILYFGDHDPSGLDMIRDIRDRVTFFLCFGDFYSDNTKVVDEHWDNLGYSFYDLTEESFHDFTKYISSLGDFESEPTDEAMRGFDAYKVFIYLRDKEFFEVIPIGLTKEQIRKYSPPPNPAKITDPRAKWYIQEHGQVSWEVDALSPQDMEKILSESIESIIDLDLMNDVMLREQKDIAEISKLIN